MRRALVALLVLGACTLAPSCNRRATQLVVVVETDMTEAQYGCVAIVVSRIDETSVIEGDRRTFDVPTVVRLPFSLGVAAPDGDAGRRVQVTAEAWTRCGDAGIGPAVVARAARTGFLSEQTLRLSLFLSNRCRTVSCLDTETCDPATGTCMAIPDIDPTTLQSIQPGDELRDAGGGGNDTGGGAVDTGVPGTDGGTPGACTPVTTPIPYYPSNGVSFELLGRTMNPDFVLVVDGTTSVQMQRSALDGSGIMGMPPLDMANGAWGIAAISPVGTNDIIAAVWRASSSRVDRHVIPVGGISMSSPNYLVGSLRQRGIVTLLGTSALTAYDQQGLGDPLVVVRIPATGGATEVFRSTVDRDVALGSRASGGALAALTDGTTAGECWIIPVSASGTAGTATPVTVATQCRRTAIAELSDGRVVLGFVDAMGAGFQLFDTALAPMGGHVTLGPGNAGRMSMSAGTDGSFRMTWEGTTSISTVHVASDGTPGAITAITATGPSYQDMRSARVGRTTGIVFPGGGGLVFAAVCD